MTQFIISPSQRARLNVVISGPRDGESENEFVARCNAVLTKADRQLIIDIADYNAGKD